MNGSNFVMLLLISTFIIIISKIIVCTTAAVFIVGLFNASICPIFSIVLLIVCFDIVLCFALYNAVYHKLERLSEIELEIKGAKSAENIMRVFLSGFTNHYEDKMNKDKTDTTIKVGENETGGFSGKFNAEISKEFTNPIGYSIIILTAGIIVIIIIYLILLKSNDLHSI